MKAPKAAALLTLAAVLAFSALAAAQTKIAIAAGSPEDRELQMIGAEPDIQKRMAMLQEFVQKFAANPAAVAYGNWQLAQQTAVTDPQKALAYGDKALAAMPDVVEILISQIDIAQQAKDYAKVVGYASRTMTVADDISKQPKPAGMSEAAHAEQLSEQRKRLQTSANYAEIAAYNAVTAEPDARRRMQEIEQYMVAFPASQFTQQVATLAIVTFQELKDSAGLGAFGDKLLAKNPEDVRLLTVLASAYVNDADNLAKAGRYARKAIELQKSKEAGQANVTLAGVAHSVLGRVLMGQGQFPTAATELKTATAMLKDSPEDLAGAYYYLGFAYAKMERAADAIAALTSASEIASPYKGPAQELLNKIKAARRRR